MLHHGGLSQAPDQGALQHYLRVHGRLVRVSRREHEKGIHPLGHESLDAHGPDERPYLDHLASPESEATVFEGSEGAAEALLERISANEAAILRLRVLEGQSLRRVSREVGISAMTVSRHEQAALAALREQLAWAPAGAGQPATNSAPLHRSTVNLALRKYGEKAKLPVAVHPHILRHAGGLALADQGADTRLIQDYLGNRKIQHTVRYTATNPARFEKLWR